eukprot:TRINITY_DN3922_c1_g1_i6.p7 TRINITY_DN3922_c1_g1~~TRINITY_DN3922_c1_g1_i6.p7  ORF type:complete len:133 (-),score=16.94 TRINITY_DN3922_c1_g1_i6:567-965(-)
MKVFTACMAFVAIIFTSSGLYTNSEDPSTDSMVEDVSQNLVEMTTNEVDLFLANPNNETLSNLLERLALPLGRVIQLVLQSGMNASESASLVGSIVGDWLNQTVEANLTALDTNSVQNEVTNEVYTKTSDIP